MYSQEEDVQSSSQHCYLKPPLSLTFQLKSTRLRTQTDTNTQKGTSHAWKEAKTVLVYSLLQFKLGGKLSFHHINHPIYQYKFSLLVMLSTPATRDLTKQSHRAWFISRAKRTCVRRLLANS